MDRQPNTLSVEFIESLYQQFRRNPGSVEPNWRDYFQSLAQGNGQAPAAPAVLRELEVTPLPAGAAYSDAARTALMQDRLNLMIRAYRIRGHLLAQLDPLQRRQGSDPLLEPITYGFTEDDLDRSFSTENFGVENVQTLRQILQSLRKTYCSFIGVQFMHISEGDVREWLQQRMEQTQNTIQLSRAEQLRILTCLTDAELFEQFIQKKYIGAKSFSLEGAESLIPLLDMAIEKGASQGVDEVVMAMAHRGRLNVLANIMGKSPQQIFREFEDTHTDPNASPGDVKYHMGHSTDRSTSAGASVHVSLCFNPSHLEFINPVAAGRLRAKQDRAGDFNRERGMALMIHGDAAFIGEGVVQETLNMSGLPGYATGGTLHIIINNQIGFTTSPEQARSTAYPSDIAKMLPIPIFHVNGENPEAVAQVVHLALEFRRTFKRDVVIDMFCFRRRGHNESDEPSFTQPLLYEAISRKPSVRDSYLHHLLQLGEITQEEADQIAAQRLDHLQQALTMARSHVSPPLQPAGPTGLWRGYVGGPVSAAPQVETRIERPELSRLLAAQTHAPEGFTVHPKIERAMLSRREMALGRRPLDWSAAEACALATLAVSGHPVRLSGQDAERGTFSHRHSVLHDVRTGATYMPLNHLAPDQAKVDIFNSPLSEAGVLGFEYGYSLDCPEGLILWEAQFGDFVNAAQVIIDQFIASAERKWQRLSGLVLLLPHGFEGQGPEHSSARLERFLTLAAEDNIQIAYPTTPAQYFHLLRRQVLSRWRKPLVMMTPKSLLRHPKAVSSLDDLAQGRFHEVLQDSIPPDPVQRVLLCSGKMYYDLLRHREKTTREDVAIIRVEQLYPLPQRALQEAVSVYAAARDVYWVQEEPLNMGAARYMQWSLTAADIAGLPMGCISRPEAASPASGSSSRHMLEQEQLINKAFEIAAH